MVDLIAIEQRILYLLMVEFTVLSEPKVAKMNFRNCATLFVLLAFSSSCISIFAQDSWPQFRGMQGTGFSESSTPAIEFTMTENVAWSAEIPGIGWSSPVVADGKIWMTTAIATKATPEQIEAKRKGISDPKIKTVAATVELRAVCVDAKSGAIVHNMLLLDVANPEMINPLNSYASPTPAIEGDRVVCHFGSYGTWCLDVNTGKKLWQTKYVVDHSVGPGSSPTVYNNKVYLVCDGMNKQFVACVDLETGRELWLTNRPEIDQPNPEYRKSYSTPLIVEIAGKKQMIIPAAQWIVSYNPETGDEYWRAYHGEGFSIAPMPIFQSGLLVFSTGYIRPEFVAIAPTGSGDVTDSHIQWREPHSSTMPSFIATNGQIISISEKGILRRLNAADGKTLEKIRVGGNYSASPIYANSHLYLCNREGVLTVIRNDKSFAKVASVKFKDTIMASPALFENDLIVRTKSKLFRIQP